MSLPTALDTPEQCAKLNNSIGVEESSKQSLSGAQDKNRAVTALLRAVAGRRRAKEKRGVNTATRMPMAEGDAFVARDQAKFQSLVIERRAQNTSSTTKRKTKSLETYYAQGKKLVERHAYDTIVKPPGQDDVNMDLVSLNMPVTTAPPKALTDLVRKDSGLEKGRAAEGEASDVGEPIMTTRVGRACKRKRHFDE